MEKNELVPWSKLAKPIFVLVEVGFENFDEEGSKNVLDRGPPLHKGLMRGLNPKIFSGLSPLKPTFYRVLWQKSGHFWRWNDIRVLLKTIKSYLAKGQNNFAQSHDPGPIVGPSTPQQLLYPSTKLINFLAELVAPEHYVK